MTLTDALTPAQAATLAALVHVHRRDGRATIDTLIAETGHSRGGTHYMLVKLRDFGLIAWEPGTQATLRPLVRAVRYPNACTAPATMGVLQNGDGPRAVDAAGDRDQEPLRKAPDNG